MFRSPLQVIHAGGKEWQLARPLVWEGHWEVFVIRTGFVTDFASIPKPVRWLLDNAGANAEAAVLHDALWRESKRPAEQRRVDPWHADGIFRAALRATGSTALTRGLMWFAVRVAATAAGRFGHQGPPSVVKLTQLVAMLTLGLLTAAAPTVVAAAGLVVYLVASWVAALVWWPFERRRLREPTNWPWPVSSASHHTDPPRGDVLVVLDKRDDAVAVARLLTAAADGELTEAEVDAALTALGDR